MLKTSVQTARILRDEALEEGFRALKEAGFEAVDFNINRHLSWEQIHSEDLHGFFDQSVEELKEYYREHKELAAKYGIAFGQMHAPFPCAFAGQDEKNAYLIQAFEKCLEVCAFLDCPYLIVHPAKCEADEEWEVNMALYKSLISVAKKTGVKVCLENMFAGKNGHIEEAVCSDFDEAARYIDTLNELAGEECFAFCFDVGHATLLGKNMYRSILKLGKRLQTLHIHDNDGINDLHMMPFTYTRGHGPVTDWDGLVKGLRAIGYSGTISLETANVLAAFPEEMHAEVLKLLHACSQYFAEKVSAEE